MEKISINTKKEKELVNIDSEIKEVILGKKWENGILTIYTPHTTSAITINENADPDVARDILSHLQELIPRNADFRHLEGNSDAHILSSLLGASEQIIIENRKMLLGTWQSIFFAEFDGPRARNIYLKFLNS